MADTGALLALFNREDPWHRACAAAFTKLRLPLATSSAVLTELFHFIAGKPRVLAVAWSFFQRGGLTLLPIGDQDLPEIKSLMELYHDRPMDFADATLVRLARRESLSTVFTIDHDDFETYRIEGHKRFRVVPAR